MKNEQIVMHSLSTGQPNLEEILYVHAAAGFRYVEPYALLMKARLQDRHKVEGLRHFPNSCINVANMTIRKLASMKLDTYDVRHVKVVLGLEKLMLGGYR